MGHIADVPQASYVGDFIPPILKIDINANFNSNHIKEVNPLRKLNGEISEILLSLDEKSVYLKLRPNSVNPVRVLSSLKAVMLLTLLSLFFMVKPIRKVQSKCI